MRESSLQSLKGHFNLVNLGCIGDEDYATPSSIARLMTVIEVDAVGRANTQSRYHRKIQIDEPIAGVAGPRTFRKNTFAGTCSLLEPITGIVEALGMENYCQLVNRTPVQCRSLPDALRKYNLNGIDLLKTDVEGADFEIIKGCGDWLGRILCIQCELRFRPFYQGEPYFHEVVGYLFDRGYEVLDIPHIDRWKYKTEHRDWQREGRAFWGDFLFVLRPEKLTKIPDMPAHEAVSKQIILAALMGKKNYAEYILSVFRSTLPPEWIPELEQLVRPRFPAPRCWSKMLRRYITPLELFLKHRINRSSHVAISQQ